MGPAAPGPQTISEPQMIFLGGWWGREGRKSSTLKEPLTARRFCLILFYWITGDFLCFWTIHTDDADGSLNYFGSKIYSFSKTEALQHFLSLHVYSQINLYRNSPRRV